MKKVVSCILAILSFMLVANDQVAAAGEDKMITKDYSITLPASRDCKIVVKITAQYMYNEASNNRGGARIYINTHCPTGKIDKLIIFMNFDHTGKAEHKITVG